MKTVKISLNSIDKVKAFVNEISKFDCDFDLVSGRYVIDAKSIMGIFSLDLSKPIDLNIHADGGLLVQVPDDGHHLLGLDDHLRGAVEISQHHKGEVAAHLPDIFHPTYDLHGLPGIGQPQLPAGMGTHLHHSFHSCF